MHADRIRICNSYFLGLLLIYFPSCTRRRVSNHGQFLALERIDYVIFFVLTLVSLGICCIVTLLLPKARSSGPLYLPVARLLHQREGWVEILVKTWHGRDLQILSLWWAVAYAGVSLVQNYGTSLFDAIDPSSKLNGHILAAAQGAGSLGAFFAIYLENYVTQLGIIIYVIGVVLMAIFCVVMGLSPNIWVAYLFYVALSGIYQTLACLLTARCGRLVSNNQFVLLLSINNFFGLLLETIIQAALEILRFSVFKQFIVYGGFFSLATLFFTCLCWSGGENRTSYEHESPEPLISDFTETSSG